MADVLEEDLFSFSLYVVQISGSTSPHFMANAQPATIEEFSLLFF